MVPEYDSGLTLDEVSPEGPLRGRDAAGINQALNFEMLSEP
jgi:hypothetical protein